MIAAIADTHALIWYLSGDRNLSDAAKHFVNQIASHGDQVAISTISIIEITYLAEKGRLEADWPNRVISLFSGTESLFTEAPINLEIAKSLGSLEGSGIADMPDRIIAATATHYAVPLITRDRAITNSAVNTIW